MALAVDSEKEEAKRPSDKSHRRSSAKKAYDFQTAKFR
jgi:hypothetical protein